MFITFKQCPHSRIYTVVPCEPFNSITVRDINNVLLVSTMKYVGRNEWRILGVLFEV